MNKRYYPVIFFFIISFIIFISSEIIKPPFNLISSLLSEPRAVLYSTVFAGDGISELDRIKEENLKLREALVKLSEIKKDNNALRAQFEEPFIPSQELLPAKIVGLKGNLNNPDAFILNRGKRSKVKEGMAVVSGKVLLGKIKKVTEYYSEVLLPFNKKFSTLGVAINNNSSGIVSGQEDFIIFDHVIITDNLDINEQIVTKGEENINGEGVPPGLIMGKLEKINKVETKPFQDAIIKSPLDFRKLTTVFIMVN